MQTTQSLAIRRGASKSPDPDTAARELHAAISTTDPALIVFYCAATYDLDRLGRALHAHFGDVPMIGCTTSGEITPFGYVDGTITGVSVTSPSFVVELGRLNGVSKFEIGGGHNLAADMLRRLAERSETPRSDNTFGFLLVDGLCMREEAVVSSLYRQLGAIQLFGGSAGDGLSFSATHVYHEGKFHRDAAVFALIQPGTPFEVFRTQHFVPSGKKMVVTRADPARRVVTEVNGEPAGREYARAVGLEVDKLTPMIFSAHPVMVRIGGQYYVRSIQKVNDDESLTFFCAIDEGIVLTVAQGVDLVENLQALFDGLNSRLGKPELVLGCDCILRNLEAGQRGLKARIGEIMAENNVIGFSTYGEQINALHVNQTFTGVAIGTSKR